MEENKKAEEVSQKETGENSEKNKKTKNLISVVILLAGLFIGSLFVDVVQLLKGSGFSQRALEKAEIFEIGGKTWVAYEEPMVNVKVVNDDACKECDPSEALVWLRRVLPTISAEKVTFDSEEGKALISKFNVVTLPAFVFDAKVVKTDFYGQAMALFDSKDNSYLLKTQELGMVPGKYLVSPEIRDQDAKFGKTDSNVKVVIFSDFQCPYSKFFWKSFRDAMKENEDRVAFAYKHLPLSFHAQANNAALASQCAWEQNKFWTYSDKLFERQEEWSKTQGSQKFKDYARILGLNAKQFSQCLESKKYQDKINADENEANSFGVAGTPATFINNQFRSGAITADELKNSIEQELNK